MAALFIIFGLIIISYLYIGGNFILFLPELGYNCTLNKLVEHMYSRYGIHIGIINDSSDSVLIVDYNKTVYIDGQYKSLYRKYNKNNNDYILDSVYYYIFNDDYKLLLNGNIYVRNSKGDYEFAADKYYTKESNNFVEVTDSKYFKTDPNNPSKLIINFAAKIESFCSLSKSFPNFFTIYADKCGD